jgi:hypothetical protein
MNGWAYLPQSSLRHGEMYLICVECRQFCEVVVAIVDFSTL